MNKKYDIFISYKRKSLPTANNLYYRLTTRGFSTFLDQEEMGRGNFNVQLLDYIENAKDVFVILEEGSLVGCQQNNWEEKDWFCHEIAFALEKRKNIIPILLNGYKMPSEDFFPDRLKELSLKNAPEFNFAFFEAYLDKLIEKKYLFSNPNSFPLLEELKKRADQGTCREKELYDSAKKILESVVPVCDFRLEAEFFIVNLLGTPGGT